jgi:hypothetical protein
MNIVITATAVDLGKKFPDFFLRHHQEILVPALSQTEVRKLLSSEKFSCPPDLRDFMMNMSAHEGQCPQSLTSYKVLVPVEPTRFGEYFRGIEADVSAMLGVLFRQLEDHQEVLRTNGRINAFPCRGLLVGLDCHKKQWRGRQLREYPLMPGVLVFAKKP